LNVDNPSPLVDGLVAKFNWWFNSEDITGKYLTFDFEIPVVIDEVKFYQTYADVHGTWKWQGSNNNSSWTDIGSSFVLGGAPNEDENLTNVQVQTELNGNINEYRYYRLLGVSGESKYDPYAEEFEFKIGEISSTSSIYLTPIGVGNRLSIITVTMDFALYESGFGGDPDQTTIVDGNLGNSFSFGNNENVAGKYLKFDFGSGNSWIITEATFFKVYPDLQFSVKWQGSNNNSSWTDIGSSFDLGGGEMNNVLVPQIQTELNGNTNSYRYYRMLGVSGTSDIGPVYEIFFKAKQ
jgi:hypothetical protein